MYLDINEVAQRLAMFGHTVGDDTSKLKFDMDLIINYVLNQCNISSVEFIPDVLKPRIIDRICSEYLYKQKNAGNLEGFNYDSVIKTIKEGDTQIQFATENEGDTPENRFDKFVDYMTKGFDKWISPHRRLRW